VTAAERIADEIRRRLPQIKHAGTLTFFGDWFGKPMDNIHTLVGVDAEGDRLVLHFDQRETLEIDDPTTLVADQRTFAMRDASRVCWRWFYYGRPRTPENQYMIEYTKLPSGIDVVDTTDWYEPHHTPDPTAAAIELH